MTVGIIELEAFVQATYLAALAQQQSSLALDMEHYGTLSEQLKGASSAPFKLDESGSQASERISVLALVPSPSSSRRRLSYITT
jgi:hypothetical protein